MGEFFRHFEVQGIVIFATIEVPGVHRHISSDLVSRVLVLSFPFSMGKTSLQRLRQFMWPFLWLLPLHFCISRSHGSSDGYIVEHHFRKLWTSTGSRSTASHSQALMRPILATKDYRRWLYAVCGSTSRDSLLTHQQRFCWAVLCLKGFWFKHGCSQIFIWLNCFRRMLGCELTGKSWHAGILRCSSLKFDAQTCASQALFWSAICTLWWPT